MIASSTLITFALLGLSAAANQELTRSKRQFLEVDGGDVVSSYPSRVLYRSPYYAGSPYYTGITSPTYVASRPAVYYRPAPVVVSRPIYRESLQYVPVRSLYRARPIVYERPVTTVIERPAHVVAPLHHYVDVLEKRRRMLKH